MLTYRRQLPGPVVAGSYEFAKETHRAGHDLGVHRRRDRFFDGGGPNDRPAKPMPGGCSQRSAWTRHDRARRTLRGIDEQVAKGERAVDGKGAGFGLQIAVD
jgi:hypothetical protein